jgi:hypothetical protein
MKKILGYILSTIGFICFVFFLKYNGTIIPFKELWFVLSFIIIVIGAYLIVRNKMYQAQLQATDNNRINQIHHLKVTGDKVKVTIDNLEVKSRTFQQELISDGCPNRMEMLDGLYDSDRNYKTKEVQQTYIVTYKQYGGKTYKFVSQATTQSPEILREYLITNNGVDLYIDKENPNNYYFDLPF